MNIEPLNNKEKHPVSFSGVSVTIQRLRETYYINKYGILPLWATQTPSFRPSPFPNMTYKTEIQKLKRLHPEYGHTQISRLIGCSVKTVKVHLIPAFKLKVSRQKSAQKTKHRKSMLGHMRQLKGNACKLCGYNQCPANLVFHHVIPSKKEFILNSCRSYAKFLNEIKKCVLLCCNCHGEIHYHGDDN